MRSPERAPWDRVVALGRGVRVLAERPLPETGTSPGESAPNLDTRRRGLLRSAQLPPFRRPSRVVVTLALIPLLAALSCQAPSGETAGGPIGRAGAKVPPGETGERDAGAAPMERAERARRLDATTDEGLKGLLEGLDDPEPLVRGVSVLSLRAAPPTDVLAGLAARPRDDVHPERRLLEIELLRALGRDDVAGYAGALCRWAAGGGAPEIRARAAAGCVEIGSPDAALLERLAADDAWTVRARTASALSSSLSAGTREPARNDLIERLADDPHPTVRNAARARLLVTRPASPARSEPQQGTKP